MGPQDGSGTNMNEFLTKLVQERNEEEQSSLTQIKVYNPLQHNLNIDRNE